MSNQFREVGTLSLHYDHTSPPDPLNLHCIDPFFDIFLIEKKAIEFAKKATEADRAERHEEALQYYLTSLEHFMTDMKCIVFHVSPHSLCPFAAILSHISGALHNRHEMYCFSCFSAQPLTVCWGGVGIILFNNSALVP